MTIERPAVIALKKAGWSPDRSVDISADMAALAREGISPFEELIDFLQAYSGLVIEFERNERLDKVWFSGLRGAELIDPGWTEEYSQRCGVRLAPVGLANHGHLTLLVGEDGSWYGGYDDIFGSLGSNFLDALENILLNRGFVARF